MEILSLDRIMVVVPDLADAQDRFARLLQAPFGPTVPATVETTAGDQPADTAYADPGIELLTPTEEDTALARYLDAYGPGLFGVVFRVRDLETAAAWLAEHDVHPIADETHAGVRETHYHPNDFSGVYVVLTEYTHPAFDIN